MPPAKTVYKKLCEHARHTAMLTATRASLEWDQQINIPAGANEYRSQQIIFFAGEIYKRQTDPQVGEWLQKLSQSSLAQQPHSDSATVIRELGRDFAKNRKLPLRLVEELAGITSQGQQIWIEARKTNNFKLFAPTLKAIFKLKREQAEALGYDDCPYDALLDEFEPRAKTREVRTVLEQLRKELVLLVAKIADSSVELPTEILHRYYPESAQRKFASEAASQIGFDFNRGRLDVAAHPFCTELGPHDCRITTRFDEHFFSSAFFGTLHESGHGMYEQGLREEFYGLPPGKSCSLGIHESQSRLWENLVGRQVSFWQHFYPRAQELFPQALEEVALRDFYRAINNVQPSLIRVEADEVTYNLHIILRFELEQELLDGDLDVADLPAAWNQRYEKYLGITPENDAEGVLQDIHWSAGLIGYFPTYALGNLIASQIFDAAQEDLGDLDLLFRMGDFQPLHEWLGKKIHQRGMCYTANELRADVAGKPLAHNALINQLQKKLAPIYGW